MLLNDSPDCGMNYNQCSARTWAEQKAVLSKIRPDSHDGASTDQPALF